MRAARAGRTSRHSAHLRGRMAVALSATFALALAGWLGEWWGPRLLSAEQPPLAAAAPEAGVPRPRIGLVLTEETRGRVLFGRYCDSCHTAGREMLGPSLRSRQFKRVYGVEEKIEEFVRTGGFDMPAFSRELLSNQDLREIARYIRSLGEER